MKKIIFAVFVFVSLVFVVSCKKEKTVTLIMSEPNPADALSALMDKAFKEKVEELSGGTLSIELYTDGILGDNTTVMKVMSQPNSTIHIARLSPATLVSYGCSKHELLDVPFTFTSHEHFWKFAASPTAQTILNEPYEKGIGVKGLFFAEEGFRHFFSTKRLATIDDFAGEKIRTAGNAAMIGVVNGLHGEPISVKFSDLYTALQTGVADVADQPIENYLSSHFNKIAPYMILDGHVLGVTEVIITSEAWDALSKKQQHILQEAATYAGTYCNQIVQSAEREARATLEAEGTEFIEVTDIAEWKAACADVIREAVKANAEMYEQIQAFAD